VPYTKLKFCENEVDKYVCSRHFTVCAYLMMILQKENIAAGLKHR